MKLNAQQKEQATKRLWELQENLTELEGIILASISGLVLTSTMPGGEYLQRGAAVSSALLLLCEHVMQTWSGDQAEAVYVKVALEEPPPRYVILNPVGSAAVLIVIYRAEAKFTPPTTALREVVKDLETVLHEG